MSSPSHLWDTGAVRNNIWDFFLTFHANIYLLLLLMTTHLNIQLQILNTILHHFISWPRPSSLLSLNTLPSKANPSSLRCFTALLQIKSTLLTAFWYWQDSKIDLAMTVTIGFLSIIHLGMIVVPYIIFLTFTPTPCKALLFNSCVFHWNYTLCFQGSLLYQLQLMLPYVTVSCFLLQQVQFQKVIRVIQCIIIGFGKTSIIFLQFLTSHYFLFSFFELSDIHICP